MQTIDYNNNNINNKIPNQNVRVITIKSMI